MVAMTLTTETADFQIKYIFIHSYATFRIHVTTRVFVKQFLLKKFRLTVECINSVKIEM